jgi:hypothetical protein
MPDRIRIIKHEAVPKSGSYEVRFSDGRESQFFYWDDSRSRRMKSKLATGKWAFAQARALLRAERASAELNFYRRSPPAPPR